MPPPQKKRKIYSSDIDDYGRGQSECFSPEEFLGGESNARNNFTPAHGRKPIRNERKPNSRPLLTEEYESNIFQLQVDELLVKVRPEDVRMVKAEHALRKLKNIIERIPNREAQSISQAEHDQHKYHTIPIPFPQPRPKKEAKFTLAYSKPTNINVVGSYARKTAIHVGGQLGIDLAITMPSSIFQEKDYLNYRYFHKRAYYMACIAAGIKEAEDCTFTISYAHQNDNQLQPIIVLGHGQDSDDFSSSKCQIRIILAVDGAMFPISKMLPNKSCVRTTLGPPASRENPIAPTPFYNASLTSECCTLAYLGYLHRISLKSAGFADACILGSVWLRQRGLGTGIASGGFGSFEWACIMALLMQSGGPKGRPILSKGYSSHQLFKAMLQYLSVKNLVASPVVVQSDILDFHNFDQPLVFDGARGMNVLFKMSPWSYAMVKDEAIRTLKLLEDPLADQFDACFITSLNDVVRRFDIVICLPIKRSAEPGSWTADAINGVFDYCRRAYQALQIGLGDRVLLIHLKLPEKVAWSPSSPEQHSKPESQIQIGLTLNSEHVNRTVDRGPSAEDKEAAATFRKFWGEKAELRRFKDGSIQESVIWSSTDLRGSILKQIIEFIIRRHIGEDAGKDLRFVGPSFDRLLEGNSSSLADSVTRHQPVMKAFEALEKDIRNLQGLPLQIRQISAADSQLRYASIKVSLLHPWASQQNPANICVQFEGSNRWPDDIAAVQRTKIAFLLKLGELLEGATTGLTARLGLENTNQQLLNSAFLDVCYPESAFFRVRIHHERELNLLGSTLKDRSHTQASREETAIALSAYKRNFIQAPLHTQAVRTLSTRFPLLSPSIRLMKKWRDSHSLSNHISDELIELLVIRTFVHPYPWTVPGSVMTGFLRTLTNISKWNWRSEPLIVDLSGEMSGREIDAIRLRFEAWRKIDPAMNRVVMFAASNLDPNGTAWTELGPSKVVGARFTSLANAACGVAKEKGFSIEPELLFATSTVDYDFIIHLNPKFVEDKSGLERSTKPVFKNLQVQVSENKNFVGLNPVQSYVEELTTLYGSNILFFYGEQGSPVIAGLWNPQTGPRPWRINLQYSTTPLVVSGDKDAQVKINKNATLHDIARLGGDIVSQIEVKH